MTPPHGSPAPRDMGLAEQVFSKEARAWHDLALRAKQAWAEGKTDEASDHFADLQDAATAWLLAIARRKGPTDQAEDFVAQAFVGLWQHLADADKPLASTKGLLGTILRNKIADAYRAASARPERAQDDAFWAGREDPSFAAGGAGNPYQESETKESVRALLNPILDALSSEHRRVLVLRHLRDFTVAQTAAALGRTEDQVKKDTQAALAAAQAIAQQRGWTGELL